MEKRVIIKIVIIIIIIILCLLTIGICFSVVALLQKKKEPLTIDEFTKFMSNNGFFIEHTKDQYGDFNYIEDAYEAVKNEYIIEFYKCTTVDDAQEFYNYNKKQVSYNSKKKTTVNIGRSYNKISLVNSTNYICVARIQDTVIYVDADKNYKDEIDKVLKELGY